MTDQPGGKRNNGRKYVDQFHLGTDAGLPVFEFTQSLAGVLLEIVDALFLLLVILRKPSRQVCECRLRRLFGRHPIQFYLNRTNIPLKPIHLSAKTRHTLGQHEN